MTRFLQVMPIFFFAAGSATSVRSALPADTASPTAPDCGIVSAASSSPRSRTSPYDPRRRAHRGTQGTTRMRFDVEAMIPDGSDGASALRGDHPGVEAGQV